MPGGGRVTVTRTLPRAGDATRAKPAPSVPRRVVRIAGVGDVAETAP